MCNIGYSNILFVGGKRFFSGKFGGVRSGRPSKKAFVMNSTTGELQERAPMQDHRIFAAATLYENKTLLVSGKTN